MSAIVLAAGLSRRMGQFKLTLPWRGTTVIGQVVRMLSEVGLLEIVAVTGHRSDEVETALADQMVRCVFNPHYAAGEMLSSIQTGLAALSQPGAQTDSAAVLVCLGDQPQMEVATLNVLLAEGMRTDWQRVVVPSYQMRAGHPILIPSYLYMQIMNTTESLRSVLRNAANSIDYLTIDSPTILADLDTPDDYAQARAESDS